MLDKRVKKQQAINEKLLEETFFKQLFQIHTRNGKKVHFFSRERDCNTNARMLQYVIKNFGMIKKKE